MFYKKNSDSFPTISPDKAVKLIKSNENNPEFVILDVRTVPEFEEAHLPEAMNLDFFSENFKEELAKKDKNKIYLVYCKSGKRSLNSVKIMEEMGFKEVYNLEGGIMKWQRNQLPLAV
jgi:rhodanese-related sulfurtransferase